MLDSLPATLTVRELSKILRIGISPAYDLVKNGTIFSVRVGRQYRIPRSAIEKYLSTQTITCT